MHYSKWTVLCALAVAFTNAGAANNSRGIYAGASLNTNQYKFNAGDVNSASFALATPQDTQVDNQALGYSFFAGYRLSRFISLEIAYSDFGAASYHVGTRTSQSCPTLTTCTPVVFPPTDYKYKTSSATIRALPSFPIGEHWIVNARIGLARVDYEIRGESYDTIRHNGTSLGLGLGATYAISQHFNVGAHWDLLTSSTQGEGSSAPSTSIAPTAAYQNPVGVRSFGADFIYRW